MNIYAGVFEWYSWRVNHLLATGFGYSWAMAMVQAEKSWRNCSATTDCQTRAQQSVRTAAKTCSPSRENVKGRFYLPKAPLFCFPEPWSVGSFAAHRSRAMCIAPPSWPKLLLLVCRPQVVVASALMMMCSWATRWHMLPILPACNCAALSRRRHSVRKLPRRQLS